MKTKNIIKIVALILFGFSIMTSCDDFGDMNQPKDRETSGGDRGKPGEGIYMSDEISAEELAIIQTNITTMGGIFKSFSYEGMYNNYQVTTNLTHDFYAGYFANFNPSWVNSTPAYAYADGWSVSRWDHFYVDRSKEYSALARSFWYLSRESKRYLNAFYITRIYYAFLASTLTDTYGEVPFSYELIQGLTPIKEEAPSGGLGTKYESQKDVYDRIFLILDDALTNLIPGQSEYNLGTDDRCYGGNEEKWLRFGNTLRLRLALRISNVDPERAKKEGEAALTHLAGLMKDQDDNMKTVPKHAPVSMGGEGTGGDENIHALCSYMWSDAGMNKDLEVAYKTQSSTLDPRCPISWYRPLDKDKSTESYPVETDKDFAGVELARPDVRKPNFDYSRIRSYGVDTKTLRDDAWFGYSRESVWMSYAECLFLKAEAALRNWNGVESDPLTYFEDGIRASMRYYHLNESLISDYLIGLKIYASASSNPFLNNDREGMLEQIITQKWLAIFPNGNEGWAEFRRTDYPALTLPMANAAEDQVAKGKFIKRIQYPFNEYDYNPFCPNTLSGTRLWWDIADTNDANGNRQKPDNFGGNVLKRILRNF